MNHRNSKRNLILSVFYALSIFTIGCVSEDEKQERRENSYDISGFYKATKKNGSEIDFEFQIRNESGRHNIIVDLERTGGLSQQEIKFLEARKIDPKKVMEHFSGKIVLGKGDNQGLDRGAENISDDFGESSRFLVCTKGYKYSKKYIIHYCLNGFLTKKSQVMKGGLKLEVTRVDTKEENNETVYNYTLETLELDYKLDAKLVFYRQYLGKWIGDVYVLVDDLNPRVFEEITVIENENGLVITKLTDRDTITYDGENFKFDAEASSVDREIIMGQSYPAIHSVYQSKNKRIVLFGQLWSLGNFTGSITIIDDEVQFDLGTFQLKKL